MKVMRQVPRSRPAGPPRVFAFGGFDGVHRGHQAVLRRLVELAGERRSESVVLLLAGPGERGVPDAPLRLTRVRTRLELLEEQGVDLVVLVSTRRLRGFGDLIGRLGVSAMVAGPASSPERRRLEEVAQRSGCSEIERVLPMRIDGCLVTRGAVHAAVAEARLAAAERLLGRPYGVVGRVVHGHHRGRPLGVPTANLRIRGIRLPPDGVYAVCARVDGVGRRGVANIGFNPTFGDRERAVETHLFDFDGDIYGRRLEVAFVERLRAERKFPDVESLMDQIRRDIATARELFSRR